MKLWLEACQATATARGRARGRRASPTPASWSAWPRRTSATGATEIIQDCVQIHGGIGVTWEHDIHLYLRRVTVNRATYGTPDEHRERIADRMLGATA